MKQQRYLRLAIIALLLWSANSFGQSTQTDTARMEYLKYLKTALRTTDTVKLRAVEQMQKEWSAAVGAVMKGDAQNRGQKLQRIAELTTSRDEKLRLLVTERELEYLYPSRILQTHIREKNERLKQRVKSPSVQQDPYVYKP